MSSNADISLPLKGFKVLDLTTFLSGPFCTQVMADLGADVVKIESPAGDSSRHIPPHFVEKDSAYFLANNRNKRSLAVDLKSADGLELVIKLIAEVDVVVENFRPGVPARLGLDIEALRTKTPSLIWASISGFGQDSPWRNRPAYDMIVQALSGVMSLTGEEQGRSVRLGVPAGDTVAGLYATIAINAALADRARSGLGRHIDVSMLDCQLAMLSYQSAYSLIAGVVPGRQGAGHDSIPTYRYFTARDNREVVITANTDRMWKGLCAALKLPNLLDDERFMTSDLRLSNRSALWDILEPAFLARDSNDWVLRLEEHDVPTALIRNVPEALDDSRQSGRDMINKMTSNEGNEIEVVGNPIHFIGGARSLPTYPPACGADANSVLNDWLDMKPAGVEALVLSGALHSQRSER